MLKKWNLNCDKHIKLLNRVELDGFCQTCSHQPVLSNIHSLPVLKLAILN